MDIITWIMAIFMVLGALDRIFGNKLGLGAEFERGATFFSVVIVNCIGMIVLAPLFSYLLSPILSLMTGMLDPSTFVGMLLANDMGAAPLSAEIANGELVGKYNGLIVSSMLGATVSYTIPYSLGIVKKEKHDDLLLGILYGIVTVPVGSFVGGLILGVPILVLLVNLIPLVLITVLIVIGLIKIPTVCTKIFKVLGVVMKILITFGLALGVFHFLTGVKLIPQIGDFSEAVWVAIDSGCVIMGALPLIYAITKILNKPLTALGKLLGVNPTSTVGLFSTLISNTTTFGIMNNMDRRGTIVNSAFAVSGAFVFAGHLAFTIAFSPDCLLAMIVGKLTAGILAIILALILTKNIKDEPPQQQEQPPKTEENLQENAIVE